MSAMKPLFDFVSAHAGTLAALAAVVSALAAIGMAIAAIATLRTSRYENTQRQQPVMVAEFQPAKHSNYAIDLVVSNVGLTVARDVRVTFDPPLDPSMEEDEQDIGKYLLRRYADTIPSIAPGQRLSNVWYSVRAASGSNKMESVTNTPEKVKVCFEYRGLGKKVLREEYLLRVETIKAETFSTSSTSIPGRMRSVDESLQAIKRALQQIARK